jgi:hypothetical protein
MGGDYPRTESIFADAEARIELAKQLVERFASHADSPAELYAVKTRKIPIETVRACADLRYLPSQIEGRPPVDHALVSLLRDAAGETTGFQFEYCDILGARAAAAPAKQTFCLREHGVRDGLFHAGGGSGDVAYLCEGYSCKALAVASLGLAPTYGGGGRIHRSDRAGSAPTGRA